MESQLFTSGGGSVPNKTAAITITITCSCNKFISLDVEIYNKCYIVNIL